MGLNGKLYGAVAAPTILALIAAIVLFASGDPTVAEDGTVEYGAKNLAAGLALFAAVAGIGAAVWLSGSVAGPLERFVRAAKEMSRGGLDMKRRLPEDGGEMGEIASALNGILDETSRSMRTVAELADRVAVASNQVASAASSITNAAQTQENQAIEVATAMDEMTVTVNEVARNATQVADQASIGTELANTGAEVVRKTIESMETIASSVRNSSATVEELGQRSAEIGQIIGVISDIADLTNLLSLNAAIEAARAGEHGRGFAVVADEVRKLAEKTSKATNEVRETISSTQSETVEAVESMRAGTSDVETGVDLAGKAEHSLSDIVSSYVTVNDMVQQIATAAEEQSTSAVEIARHIESIAGTSKSVSTGIQEIAKSAKELASSAERMHSEMNRLGAR